MADRKAAEGIKHGPGRDQGLVRRGSGVVFEKIKTATIFRCAGPAACRVACDLGQIGRILDVDPLADHGTQPCELFVRRLRGIVVELV